MDFAVHNSVWEPKDFDGIKLMWHPSAKTLERQCAPKATLSKRFTRAERLLFARNPVPRSHSESAK